MKTTINKITYYEYDAHYEVNRFKNYKITFRSKKYLNKLTLFKHIINKLPQI